MKKTVLLITALFALLVALGSCEKKKNTPAYDNSLWAVEMEEQYVGTYLPKEFIDTLCATKSYVKAMRSEPNGNHIIAVEKNIVYANDDYYDQYAYRKEYVENFVFESDGDEMVLTYEGKKYVRISDSPDYYRAMTPFVLNIMFAGYKDIKITSYNKIEIQGEEYKFLHSIGFYEYDILPELFLADSESQYSCRIHDGKMELRKLEEKSLVTKKESEEIAKVFILTEDETPAL